jgi:dipeptidyl aminopeptidase/acylaminoacyl peptidase
LVEWRDRSTVRRVVFAIARDRIADALGPEDNSSCVRAGERVRCFRRADQGSEVAAADRGRIYERNHRTIAWLDPEWQRRADEVGKALPGTLNVPVSSSRDGNVVVLESTSPTTVPTYYLYNAAAKKLTRIGVSHPEIPSDTVAERRPVRYQARDGMTIPAYLTVPRGGDGKHLPTIIFPHGGPYARDTDEFDYWTEYFVSRGYAVLQPNFRGSVGYKLYMYQLGKFTRARGAMHWMPIRRSNMSMSSAFRC